MSRCLIIYLLSNTQVNDIELWKAGIGITGYHSIGVKDNRTLRAWTFCRLASSALEWRVELCSLRVYLKGIFGQDICCQYGLAVGGLEEASGIVSGEV